MKTKMPEIMLVFEWGNDNWYGSTEQLDALLASDDAPEFEVETAEYERVAVISDSVALYVHDVEPGNGRQISVSNPARHEYLLFEEVEGGYRLLETYDTNPLLSIEAVKGESEQIDLGTAVKRGMVSENVAATFGVDATEHERLLAEVVLYIWHGAVLVEQSTFAHGHGLYRIEDDVNGIPVVADDVLLRTRRTDNDDI